MNMNLFAALNTTSYGYVGSYMLRELSKTNDVKYFPITQVNPDIDLVNDLHPLVNSDVLINDGPCLKIWHQHDLAAFIGKGPRIGFPIFELDKFTDREKNHLSSCDGLVVCSEWAKNIIHNHLPDATVDVVPLGYDPDVFKPVPPTTSGPFVFANFGKWEVRKGHDILKDIFNAAFTQSDDVELWLTPHNFHIDEYKQRTWESFYKNSNLGNKIRIFPRQLSQKNVAEIMSKVHVGIFPARAEGWNLEALELIAMGKKVIATNYSGHTAFLNDTNSYLVECRERELAYDGVFFHGQGSWAKFTKDMFDQMVALMRTAYNNGYPANLTDQSPLTWTNTAIELTKVLEKYV